MTGADTKQQRALFPEISVVRVKQLLKPNRDYDGFSDHARAPLVDDEGTIVGVYTSPGQPPAYHVECLLGEGEDAGSTIWLAIFEHDELELVRTYEGRQRDGKQ
jgi:hypothetical protein